MKSELAEAVKLEDNPVAVLFADDKPEQAIQFAPDRWGCVVAMIVAAARGKWVAFDEDTCGCGGGSVGLGFGEYGPGIATFLSTGTPEQEGERYKKTPEYARAFAESLPEVDVPTEYVVLKPLGDVEPDETPEVVIFLANADQLSGLVTMANYDRPTGDNVVLKFGAGCHSALLLVLAERERAEPRAVVGMTDPSARKVLPPGVLSFSVTYDRFLELEEQVDESFFITPTWQTIAERIE